MTQIKKYDRKTRTEALVTVKVGDVVRFKSDHEQRGTITKIDGEYLHLRNEGGGHYQHQEDCWI